MVGELLSDESAGLFNTGMLGSVLYQELDWLLARESVSP